MDHNEDTPRQPPTVERDHDDDMPIVISGDLLAELFGGAA